MAAKPLTLFQRLRAAARVMSGAPVPARPRASQWGTDGGNFRGAAATRFTANDPAALRSVDLETRYDLATLRARARALVRNNSYASGFVGEVVSNVIGARGIALQAQIRDAGGVFLKPVNKELERAWLDWSLPDNASASTTLSWVDQQRLYVAQMVTDGELLFRKIRYADNPHGFALQPLDPDFLDHTYNQPATAAGVAVRMGVEVDRYGKPLAYHLWDRHPSETARRRVRVPAAEIVHDFIPYRVGQVRGVTWFAPVLTDVMTFDSLTIAELQSARVAAATMGFILNTSPDAVAAYHEDVERERSEREARGEEVPEPTPLTFEADPGVIHELAPGQELGQFDPKHPSPEFGAFAKVILRGVARGLHISYSSLTGDLESVNYSSTRAGLLPERDHWRQLQEWVATHVHRRVYREWLEMALLAGAVALPSLRAADYQAVAWMPRGWKWVDPLKDAQAAKELIALGLESRRNLAAEQGRDFEEILADLADEQRLAADYGVDIAGLQPAGSARPDGREDAEGDDTREAAPDDDANEDDAAQATAPRRVLPIRGGKTA